MANLLTLTAGTNASRALAGFARETADIAGTSIKKIAMLGWNENGEAAGWTCKCSNLAEEVKALKDPAGFFFGRPVGVLHLGKRWQQLNGRSATGRLKEV